MLDLLIFLILLLFDNLDTIFQVLLIIYRRLIYALMEALIRDHLHKNYAHNSTSEECMSMNSNHLSILGIPYLI